MSLVYVYKQNKKYDCVLAQYLLNFDIATYLCADENERMKIVYGLKKPGCQRELCIVLAVAESEEEMEEITKKRLKVPKLNSSEWVEQPIVQVDKIDVAWAKRKESTKQKADNYKVTNTKVLAAYLNRSYDRTDDEGQSSNAKTQISSRKRVIASLIKNRSIKESDDSDLELFNDSKNSEEDNGELSSFGGIRASTPKRQRSKLIDDWNSGPETSDTEDVTLLKTKLAIAVAEKDALKKKYEQLKHSKPLTEETGKKLLALVTDKGPKKVLTPEKFGTVRDGRICIGNDVWIKLIAYNEAKQAKKPSGFVLNMCYATWSVEALAERVVRKASNCNREKVITPEKREAISNVLDMWLKDSGYSGPARTNERALVNSYIGRAIDRCKKTLKLEAKYNNKKKETGKATKDTASNDETELLKVQQTVNREDLDKSFSKDDEISPRE